MIGAFGFELEYPKFYLFFFPTLLLGGILAYNFFRQNRLEKALTPALLRFDGLSKGVLFLFPPLILALLTFALMGPRGNPRYSENEVKEEETRALKSPLEGTVLLVVDTSRSMTVKDTSTKESRLSAAKELAEEIVALSPTAYKGLFAFGDGLIKVVPRTADSLFVRLMIKQLQPDDGGAGTQFVSAFEALGKTVKEIPDPVAVVFLSDGEDPSLMASSEREKKARYEKIAKTFLDHSGRRVPIYVVAFGTKEGKKVPEVTYKGKEVISKRDDALLKTLASDTRGNLYIFEAENKNFLAKKIVKALAVKSGLPNETLIKEAQESLIWTRYFQAPLFIALALLGIFFFFPASNKKKGALLGLLIFGSLQGTLTDEWEKGALIYNQAIELIQAKEVDKAEMLLETLRLESPKSFYVLGKLNELEALIALEKKEKASKTLRPILNLFALMKLEKSGLMRCQFQKQKGYEKCPSSYFIEEMKKGVKLAFDSKREESPLTLASYGLEWSDRVRLVIEEPSYYTPFQALLDDGTYGVFREALNNFQQKDFEESLTLFERESARQLKLLEEIPRLQLFEEVLSFETITPWDLRVLGVQEDSSIMKKFRQADPLGGRLLLAFDYFLKQKEAAALNTPKQVIEWVLKAQELAFIIEMVSKASKPFAEQSQDEVLVTLEPFLKVMKAFRVDEFEKEGCETAPWAEIIPLFEKGKVEATSALNALKEGASDKAEYFQLQAIETFKELLNLLNAHQKDPKMSKAKEQMSESIRQLQDFELSDRALKGKAPAGYETERPW